MRQNMNRSRRAVLRALGLGLAGAGLAGCRLPTAPTPTTEPGPPQPVTPPPPTAAPATVTAAPAPPPLIRADNLERLAAQVVVLPEYPERILWPAQAAALPGGLTGQAAVLFQAGLTLYPVLLDGPGPRLGQPAALPFGEQRLLAAAPDARSAVLAGADGEGASLAALDGSPLRTLAQPAQPYGATYSRDGRFLVITSAARWEAVLYDLAAGPDAPPVVLTGFETAAPVYAAQPAPGGQVVAWHARASLELQSVDGGDTTARRQFTDFIGNMAFAYGAEDSGADGGKLALDAAGRLYLLALPGGEELTSLALSTPPAALDFAPGGGLLAGSGPALQFWDGATLAPLAALPVDGGFAGLLAFAPDGRRIAATHEGGRVSVWSAQ